MPVTVNSIVALNGRLGAVLATLVHVSSKMDRSDARYGMPGLNSFIDVPFQTVKQLAYTLVSI